MKSELKTLMMEEWINIDSEITHKKKLVKSISRRLKTVLDAKRYPTKYLFNEKRKYLLMYKDFF